jgi:Mn-containing catalase
MFQNRPNHDPSSLMHRPSDQDSAGDAWGGAWLDREGDARAMSANVAVCSLCGRLLG